MNHKEYRDACLEADKRMKQSDGHSYMTILKTRCQYCGRSPRQKGRCSQWFITFVDQLEYVLAERGVITTYTVTSKV